MGDHPAVVEHKPRLHVSLDGESYYVTEGNRRCQHWLGTKKLDEQPGAWPFMGGGVQFKLKDGAEYIRVLWPFAFWSIKVNHDATEVIERDDERYLDYAASSQWDPAVVFGEIPGLNKDQPPARRAALVAPGDWILAAEDGSLRVVSAADFARDYDPA